MEIDSRFYVATFVQRDVFGRLLVICAYFVLLVHDNVVPGLLDRA